MTPRGICERPQRAKKKSPRGVVNLTCLDLRWQKEDECFDILPPESLFSDHKQFQSASLNNQVKGIITANKAAKQDL